MKPSTPTQAIDVHMGEEEKNKRKKQGMGPQLIYLDLSVASYNLHGSYGGLILNLPTPRRKPAAAKAESARTNTKKGEKKER